MTDLITKLEELLEAATDLPWAWDVTDPDPLFQTNYNIYPVADCEHSIAEVNGQINKSADTRLIVEAVNSLPELIQELRSLQARNDELETRFWSIVDRDGLTGLPSDMWAALEILVNRAPTAPRWIPCPRCNGRGRYMDCCGDMTRCNDCIGAGTVSRNLILPTPHVMEEE